MKTLDAAVHRSLPDFLCGKTQSMNWSINLCIQCLLGLFQYFRCHQFGRLAELSFLAFISVSAVSSCFLSRNSYYFLGTYCLISNNIAVWPFNDRFASCCPVDYRLKIYMFQLPACICHHAL